ncbi:GNAT family N-acetyltransferase [Leifsonia sp. A12D58]|uniref:GNAT family N-acetyltransferase n=1 Tax=Leifsonia sp. A12D58 TaxID=3397674 RepID=UPI0039E1C791
MLIRLYEPTDARATLEIFTRAVHETAAGNYTAAQLAAWAPSDRDAGAWAQKRMQAETLVAVDDGSSRVIGFTDLDATGYIDMMFVHPDWARRGVATALLDEVVDRSLARGIQTLTTHASLTARPFFAAHGFVVTEQREPVLRGVALTNFAMLRVLRPTTAP